MNLEKQEVRTERKWWHKYIETPLPIAFLAGYAVSDIIITIFRAIT